MTPAAIAPAIQGPSPIAEEIAVLVVGEGAVEAVDAAVDDDRLTIRTAPSLPDADADLEDVDCLVGDYAPETGDGLLERVARWDPDLPIVLLVDGETAIDDALDTHRWIDWLDRPAATGADRLAHRIRSLVERRRLAALSRRSLTGVELAGDAVAIVAADGAVQFENRAFAMQFGYDRDELTGRSWRTLFADESVDRLETAAVPTIADGWRWTGTCTGRRKSGATFPVRVRLGGPGDGSLVFVVETPDDGAGTPSDESA